MKNILSIIFNHNKKENFYESIKVHIHYEDHMVLPLHQYVSPISMVHHLELHITLTFYQEFHCLTKSVTSCFLMCMSKHIDTLNKEL